MAQSNALQKHQSTQAVNDAKTPKCQTPCCERKDKDDKLAKKTQAVIDKVKADPSATAKYCQDAVNKISNRLERFNSYREALPSARAAYALNQLKDKDAFTKKLKQPCLTALPLDAKKLNTELGLPQGTITDTMLRNDDTGFRAALFKDEATGKTILVARDTQPDSLVDWSTNINNGKGEDTPQYKAMRDLTKTLKNKKVPFDIAGYSKGAGLAQEAGLIAENAQVRVFNAAGLHENSLGRTGGAKSFDGLIKRTKSFSSEGEFLTFMNETTDAQQQIDNAIFLRKELAGEGRGINPMKIKYRNPAMREAYDEKGWLEADPDPDFKTAKNALLDDMTKMITSYQQKLAANTPFRMFPPVRSGHHETIVDSHSSLAMYMPNSGDINANELNLAKMIQHQMSAVLNPMEEAVKTSRHTFNYFQARCGPA